MTSTTSTTVGTSDESTTTAAPVNLLPPLDAATEDALRASIEKHGVLVPIVVDIDGNVLDGAHRLKIWKEHETLTPGERTKWFAARTNLSWGRMLLERGASGDEMKAKLLLTTAWSNARKYGYGTVERRASTALQQVG